MTPKQIREYLGMVVGAGLLVYGVIQKDIATISVGAGALGLPGFAAISRMDGGDSDDDKENVDEG